MKAYVSVYVCMKAYWGVQGRMSGSIGAYEGVLGHMGSAGAYEGILGSAGAYEWEYWGI